MIPHVVQKDLKLVSCFGARPRVHTRRRTFRSRPLAATCQRLSSLRHRRSVSKLSASSSTEASTSLATYNLEFRHRHCLFESFLVELIKHLDDAPVLQSVMVSDEITFHHEKSLLNDDNHHRRDQYLKDSDVFMYCKAISKDPVPGGRKYLTGSIGDCCEESSSIEDDQDSQFWGLVVKSSLFPRMEGCYLLRTSRVSAGAIQDCLCTHYSLTKISAGISLADQYDASWLA